MSPLVGWAEGWGDTSPPSVNRFLIFVLLLACCILLLVGATLLLFVYFLMCFCRVPAAFLLCSIVGWAEGWGDMSPLAGRAEGWGDMSPPR